MKNHSDAWKKMPLHRAVLEIVLSKPEGVTESKLIESLKKEYQIEPSRSELYQVLMKLELQDLIHVEQVGKDFLIKVTPQAKQQFLESV